MKLSNKWYDILKYVCQIAMPAILTCAATIMGLLNVDTALIATIVGIGAALNTLLGTLLGISTANYNKEIAEAAKKEDNIEWEEHHDAE